MGGSENGPLDLLLQVAHALLAVEIPRLPRVSILLDVAPLELELMGKRPVQTKGWSKRSAYHRGAVG